MTRIELQAEYWRRYRAAALDLKAGTSPWYARDYIVQIIARDACAAALAKAIRTEANQPNSLDHPRRAAT